jgi:hypothetical protein
MIDEDAVTKKIKGVGIDPHSKRGEEILSKIEKMIEQGETDIERVIRDIIEENHNTGLKIAKISFFAAVIPGIISVLVLVIDKMIPDKLPADAAVVERTEIDGTEYEVYNSPSEEEYMIYDEQAQEVIKVYKDGKRWVK